MEAGDTMKQVIAVLTISLGVMCCVARAQNLVPANDIAFVANDYLADSGEDRACDNCSCCGEHCLGGICTRQRLFGNLLGGESCLAQRGIVADLELTQFYQGVSSGGADRDSAYGGKMDYMFTFLGEPLGLNKGFRAIMHAETRFGESLVGQAGAFAFPNTNMLYPLPTENDTAITGLLVLQALNERVALAAGKINVVDFWTMVYPHVGRGVDGFMNINCLAAALPWLRFVNLSVNGAGVLVMEGEQLQGGVLVFDTNNSTTTVGLNNLFDQGAGVLGVWRFFTDWQGKPGSHLFAFGGSTRTYTSLDRNDWYFVPGQGGGLTPGEETGAWALAYYFDQVFWADPCNADRNLRVFSGFSLSDGNPSFGRWSGMASVEGYGLIHGREQDRMGVSYF